MKPVNCLLKLWVLREPSKKFCRRLLHFTESRGQPIVITRKENPFTFKKSIDVCEKNPRRDFAIQSFFSCCATESNNFHTFQDAGLADPSTAICLPGILFVVVDNVLTIKLNNSRQPEFYSVRRHLLPIAMLQLFCGDWLKNRTTWTHDRFVSLKSCCYVPHKRVRTLFEVDCVSLLLQLFEIPSTFSFLMKSRFSPCPLIRHCSLTRSF